MGKMGLKDEVFASALHGFILLYSCPHFIWQVKFSCPSPPFEAPPHPVKLVVLLIWPTIIYKFFMFY